MRKIILLYFFLACSCSLVGTDGSSNQLDIQVRNAERQKMDMQLEQQSQAMYHFLVGQLQYDKQDFDKALKNFETASSLVTEPAPVLHTKLAELFVRSGQLEKALEEIEKAKLQNSDDINVMLLYAGILEAMGKTSDAEPVYESIIQKHSNSLDAYVLLSSLYSKKADYPAAIKILEKYLNLHPKEVVAITMIARIHELKGNYIQADSYLKRARAIDPANTNVAIEHLRIMLKQKKIKESKQLCNQILERDPNNIIARKIIGQLLLGESNFEEALKHLQFLENIEIDAKDTRYKIALIQIGKQNFKEAIIELNLVLAADPNYPEARYYLASSYVATGRKKEAIEELLKIQAHDKMYVQSRMLAAFILRKDQELKEAEAAIKEAHEARSDDLSIASYYVVILRERKKQDEAKEILEKILSTNPENDKILFSYATLLSEMEQKQAAMTILEKVIVINPNHSDALNFLAYELAESKNDLNRAEILVKKALDVKPNDGYYLDTLGWIYYLQGRYNEASETLARAVVISNEDPVVLEHYAEALLKQGQTEKAVEQFKIGATKSFEADGEESKKAIERMTKKYKELGGK